LEESPALGQALLGVVSGRLTVSEAVDRILRQESMETR
jgi:hypothetical protein